MRERSQSYTCILFNLNLILIKLFFLIYLIVLFSLRGISNMLFLLIQIEVLSWIFSVFLKRNSIKYLIIQRYFLIIRIIGLLFNNGLLVISLLLKLGFPPFHLWIVFLLKKLNFLFFSFFMTIHKLRAIRILSKLIREFLTHTLMCVLTMTVIYIIRTKSFQLIIIFSSILHRGWMVILSSLKFFLFLIYWTTYRIIIILWLKLHQRKSLKVLIRKQRKLSRFRWLLLSGFPPFSIFWLKLALFSLLIKLSFRISFLIALLLVLSLSVYYRIFHFSIKTTELRIIKELPFLLVFIRILWI